jgi:hypothetical protein
MARCSSAPAASRTISAGPSRTTQQARAANGGALPPDLSLITKAREGGAQYIHALLTGYVEPPEGVTVAEGMHYNQYFPGHQIAMAPPLSDGQVTFADGTPTVDADGARRLRLPGLGGRAGARDPPRDGRADPDLPRHPGRASPIDEAEDLGRRALIQAFHVTALHRPGDFTRPVFDLDPGGRFRRPPLHLENPA